jgi:hypothetical protein
VGARTVNTFWTGHGSLYQQLCLASWVAHGFDAVVYTIDADMQLPEGVKKRPATEILDLDGKIYRYKTGFGEGSPSLHANLFRYQLLLRGGWWLDADVVVRSNNLPEQDIFLAWQANKAIGNAIMRFPADSPVMHDAVLEALRVADNASWAQTGPTLITQLVEKHNLSAQVAGQHTAYAIDFTEMIKFLDPAAKEEVDERVAGSTFVHLWNQIWTAIGFPQEFGPPEGSYIDFLFKEYVGRSPFRVRMPLASIRTWWQNRQRIIKLQDDLRQVRANDRLLPSEAAGAHEAEKAQRSGEVG